jgi:hypothetical protein
VSPGLTSHWETGPCYLPSASLWMHDTAGSNVWRKCTRAECEAFNIRMSEAFPKPPGKRAERLLYPPPARAPATLRRFQFPQPGGAIRSRSSLPPKDAGRPRIGGPNQVNDHPQEYLWHKLHSAVKRIVYGALYNFTCFFIQPSTRVAGPISFLVGWVITIFLSSVANYEAELTQLDATGACNQR